MDSDLLVSQPTQLLQHALASGREHGRDWHLASPNDDGDATNDFSLDSRIIPTRQATPRYHTRVSLLQSPGQVSGERVLVEDSQKEVYQENGEQIGPSTASLASSDNVPVQGSGSEFFDQHETSPLSAIGKVIGTGPGSFQSPPTTTAAVHPLSPTTKSMPVNNRYYPRSPSLPSQDSFGGPISQDPAEQYLASTKQFDVPLSDLGETPTQEVIHSPTDPGATLPDASEHKEFLEAAMREYEARRANRAASNRRTNVLVAATPGNSGESSDVSQYKDDSFSFHNCGPELAGQGPRFEFNGSSSFDKMLDRDLDDSSDPAELTLPKIEQVQVDGVIDAGPYTEDDTLTTPPFDEWIAPSPSAAVASSNPRSLLRMVHPGNQYRIAKMRNLAGDVEPPSCVTTGVVTQPSHLEETQPCHTNALTQPNPQLAPRSNKTLGSRPARHQAPRKGKNDELEDSLDIVPDSEPLRAGPSAPTPGHHRSVIQSPLKKLFHPLSPMSAYGSGDLVPDSLEVEGSEADIPLAIELASKKTKKSTAPAEDMIAHGRKTRAASVPEKLLPLEKQPQKPASSTKGKNSKVKPFKTEPTEVPTSLPEQDLQGQAYSAKEPPTTAADMPPSKKKKGRGSQPLEPSRARPASTCLPVTKPVAGKKRMHESDTETSECDTSRDTTDDEGAAKVPKEEEEETDSADDFDLAPPPPLKPDIRRKKRRCIEDVNPVRGTSKASTSTRNKQSETPAVITRSVKRLRSGVSSTRGLTAEPATRVFALWKQDGHYYSGVVHSRGSKSKYLIKFDDGTEDEVELKNMRRRELQVGDRVIAIQDNVKAVVSDVNHVDSHGTFKLEIDVDHGGTMATNQVGFGDIRIANRTIQSQWKERVVVADSIVTVVKLKPLIDPTPSKESVASATSGKPQRELVKTGFVVTINPKNEDPTQTKDVAMRAIKSHGGLVIEDWSSVFTMEGRHSHANKRWIATPQDFHWRPEVKLDRVFLLSDDAHQKPKFLLALALGIPCLSFEWLLREGKFSSDWQPFLLPAGYSDTLGARISQLVDLDWGNCTEHLTDIMVSRVPIKLFSQKTVLCIGSELVPLPSNRARKNTPEEASRYVPWIILCMGAARVEAATDTKLISAAHMETFDYIIVKERSVLGSIELGEGVVVGDVGWVKECLVSSRLSIPALD